MCLGIGSSVVSAVVMASSQQEGCRLSSSHVVKRPPCCAKGGVCNSLWESAFRHEGCNPFEYEVNLIGQDQYFKK